MRKLLFSQRHVEWFRHLQLRYMSKFHYINFEESFKKRRTWNCSMPWFNTKLKAMSAECGKIAHDVSSSGPQSVRTVSQQSNVKVQHHSRYFLFFFFYFFCRKNLSSKITGKQNYSLQSAGCKCQTPIISSISLIAFDFTILLTWFGNQNHNMINFWLDFDLLNR